MEYILIKPGDDVIRMELVLSALEMKALYNLLIEQDSDMITYHEISKKIENKLKQSKNENSI